MVINIIVDWVKIMISRLRLWNCWFDKFASLFVGWKQALLFNASPVKILHLNEMFMSANQFIVSALQYWWIWLNQILLCEINVFLYAIVRWCHEFSHLYLSQFLVEGNLMKQVISRNNAFFLNRLQTIFIAQKKVRISTHCNVRKHNWISMCCKITT